MGAALCAANMWIGVSGAEASECKGERSERAVSGDAKYCTGQMFGVPYAYRIQNVDRALGGGASEPLDDTYIILEQYATDGDVEKPQITLPHCGETYDVYIGSEQTIASSACQVVMSCPAAESEPGAEDDSEETFEDDFEE